jgi:hypothetical protein
VKHAARLACLKSRFAPLYSLIPMNGSTQSLALRRRWKRSLLRISLSTLLVANPVALHARGTYQQPEEFIKEAFNGHPPPPKLVWLTGSVENDVARILGHKYPALRLRYWMLDARSAWILEEIGKEEPITVGIVINQGKIEQLRVLIFRESRGDEVRHLFFTRQFNDGALTRDGQFDRPIDAISGATLSVQAVTELARVALYLHAQVVR